MDLEMDKPVKTVKVVVVGEGAVGKTAMTVTYAHKYFPTEYTATVFDNYPTDIEVGGVQINMNIWDTGGLDEFEDLRKLTYPGTDVFVVCFDLTNGDSRENILNVWIPDLRERVGQTTPIILVGTKSERSFIPPPMSKGSQFYGDPEGYESYHITSYKQGVQLAKKIGAAKYLECSAKNNDGLEAVFHEAAKIGFGWRYKK